MSSDPNKFSTEDVRAWDKPQQKQDKVFPVSPNPAVFPIGLTSLDIDKRTNVRIRTNVDNVTKDSIDVHIDTWADTILYSASCTWLEVYAKDRDIQCGRFSTEDDHPWNVPQAETSRKIKFAKPFAPGEAPKVIVWLNQLDMGLASSWRCKAYASDITNEGFTIHIDTWADTVLYSGVASWIAHPSNRPNIHSGTFNTMEVRAWNQPQLNNAGTVTFDKPFQTVPRVITALNWLDIACTGNLRLRVDTKNVKKNGMDWELNAWADTTLYSAGASYIAIQDF